MQHGQTNRLLERGSLTLAPCPYAIAARNVVITISATALEVISALVVVITISLAENQLSQVFLWTIREPRFIFSTSVCLVGKVGQKTSILQVLRTSTIILATLPMSRAAGNCLVVDTEDADETQLK